MDGRKGKNSVVREIISWVVTIGIALIVAMIIRTFVYETMQVPTGSMIKTINVGDTFFVNKYVYKFTEVKRGDIAVFWYPDNPTVRYVKRVIGVGGDSVEIKNEKLYINGIPQDEPYLNEPMNRGNYGPYKVPEGKYFMMGDNRNDSLDSRFWKEKFVSKEAIIGRPDMRLYPFNRLGLIR